MLKTGMLYCVRCNSVKANTIESCAEVNGVVEDRDQIQIAIAQ